MKTVSRVHDSYVQAREGVRAAALPDREHDPERDGRDGQAREVAGREEPGEGARRMLALRSHPESIAGARGARERFERARIHR